MITIKILWVVAWIAMGVALGVSLFVGEPGSHWPLMVSVACALIARVLESFPESFPDRDSPED